MTAAIEAESLSKSFGETKSVDGITFKVDASEVYGFLGANGAGKSTTMMMLTTLLRPTSGSARVAGYDVVREAGGVRSHIGFVQQENAVDEYLTGRENLVLQARLNRVDKPQAERRIDELLDTIGLADRQHDATVTYSGGMKKRLDIACGLLHRPSVLFLDEPTVGLDIQTRQRIWESIRRMHREHDMTVFLSTHYMEEADELCDRICIIDEGRIKAIGRPVEMKGRMGRDVIVMDAGESARLLADCISSMSGSKSVDVKDGKVTAYVHDGAAMLPEIFAEVDSRGIPIHAASISKPTLDDVYISYTGRQIREHGAEPRRRKR